MEKQNTQLAKPIVSEIRIFFSWQSDLLREATTNALKEALASAITEIEDEFSDIKIIIDEATRDIPGSPDIPTLILEKIECADIFISDITTINSHITEECRKTANPNVLIELGFAFSELGWERIIMVFNEEFGKFPDDIAFDIDRKRISKFSVKNKSDKSGKAQLKILLIDAIKLIISHNPLKPFEKKRINPKEKKRSLDILNLKLLMATVNIPMLDNHIDIAPLLVNTTILHYFESFRGVYKSSSFFLYDKTALKLIDEFYNTWNITLSEGELYYSTNSLKIVKFGNPNGLPLSKCDKLKYEELEHTIKSLHIAFIALLDYLRNNYLELDLNELSEHAYNKYIEFRRNFSLPS